VAKGLVVELVSHSEDRRSSALHALEARVVTLEITAIREKVWVLDVSNETMRLGLFSYVFG